LTYQTKNFSTKHKSHENSNDTLLDKLHCDNCEFDAGPVLVIFAESVASEIYNLQKLAADYHYFLQSVGNRLNPLTPTVAMGTAIKHPVPDRVKQSFVIF